MSSLPTPSGRWSSGKSGCPDEDYVAGFVAGTLDRGAGAELEAHLDGCAACRRLVALALASTGGEPLRAPAPLLEPGDKVARYVILNVIGAGGMGIVYSAHDPELDRRVAIKLLWRDPRAGATPRQDRIRREAQSLARLSHANVVSVYDVGVVGEQIFVVMELVGGTTLRRWLADLRRPPSEVRRVMIAAGRGLAAAHAAGLIHRDFKPSNVLVDEEGRVRVVDFGLARTLVEPREEPDQAPALLAGGDLGASLTERGAILGTPLYMAPEQHLGQVIDARADQFAFCVSLFEALYGVRPFDESSLERLRAAVLRGEVRGLPRGARSGASAWVRRVILRGLAPRPDDRYPSMDALLADLARDPRSPLRWALVACGAAAISAALVVGGRRSATLGPEPCHGGLPRVAAVWDAGRKEAVRAAFTATGAPYAERTFRSVDEAIGARLAAWAQMHDEACAATRVRGEQPEEVLGLRMMCLDERLAESKGIVDAFTRADLDVTAHATEAMGKLGSVAECADVRALSLPVRPPRDAAASARVEALRARAAGARAAVATGKLADALPEIEAVVQGAKEVPYSPLVAEALLQRGWVELQQGREADAERTLIAAVRTAVSCGHDLMALRAEIKLVLLIGFKEGRFAEGHRWAELARGALEHLGSSPADEVELLEQESAVFYTERRQDEGAELLRRSIAMREEHPSSSDADGNMQLLGYAFINQDRLDEALALYRRALPLNEAAVGPEHPTVAAIHNNIGYLLWAQGDYAGSLAAQQRALDIRSKLREGSAEVGQSLVHRGNVLRALGRVGEALADHRRALSIFEAARLEADRPQVTWAIEHIGRDLLAAGRYDEAERALQDGRARLVGRKDPDEDSVATFDALLGGVALGRGDARLAATRLAAALPTLERKNSPNYVIAEARFWLAQALDAAGRDRAKARALAEQARGTYATLPGRTRERAAIDAWLGKLAQK